MPGAFRPYTLQDILGVLSGQSASAMAASTAIDGIGYIGEVDESSTSSDTASALVVPIATQVWDRAQWGGFTWG